jgi:hypothetical protein
VTLVRVDGGAERKLEASGKKQITIDLPKGKRLDLRVQALDESGNRVAVVGTADVPLVIVGPGGGEPVVTKQPPKPVVHHEDAHPRPLYLSWWLWGGAAVALGAGATYFGLAARDETDRLTQLNATSFDHRFTEASSLESDARRDAMIFNVGIGLAGAAAIGAAILYLTEPRAETRVVAAPVNGGAAVVVGGRF